MGSFLMSPNNSKNIKLKQVLKTNGNTICADPDVVAHFSLDECHSFIDVTNLDYSEFEPEYLEEAECGSYRTVGGFLYRRNPVQNIHSCTPGLGEGLAMCVSASDSCTFVRNDDQAVRIDLRVMANPDDVVILSGMRFFEQAPVTFNWILGASGINNYPLNYGIRILKNGEEIFLQDNIETQRTWNEELFDFTNIPEFTVTDTSVFNFELFPYCLAGIDSTNVSVWDLDEISILSCCEPCGAQAGSISTDDPTIVCVNDTQEDILDLIIAGDVIGENTIVITDSLDQIILLTDDTSLDIGSFNLGTCFIQNLAYEGTLEGLVIGAKLSDVFGCFSTSNQIAVVRAEAEGGTISTTSETEFCTGDGIDDIVEIELSGNIGIVSTFLMTNTDGLIIDILSAPFNFEGTSGETCLIWHASSFEMLGTELIGSNINDIQSCFDLSNSIEIRKRFVDAGEINNPSSQEICLGDSNPANVNFEVLGAQGDQLIFVVSDSDGNILAVSENSNLNFEDLSPGIVQVRHVALSSELEFPLVGSNISGLEDCFDLSNVIELTLVEVDGGVISTSGATEVCIGDGEDDIIEIELEGNIGAGSKFVITNEDGIILDLVTPPINFEIFDGGTCVVRHISTPIPMESDLIGFNINDFTSCVSISNAIELEKVSVEAGQISTTSNIDLCLGGDVFPDLIEVEMSGGSPNNALALIVTDVVTDDIVLISDVAQIDFSGFISGSYLIRNFAFGNSNDVPDVGTNISEIEVCFDVSNSLEVSVVNVSGGQISSQSDLVFCTGDDTPDNLEVNLQGSEGANMTYLISDENGIILMMQDSSFFDFDGLPSGNCEIRHLAYDNLSGLEIGSSIDSLVGCFSLSNALIVERTRLLGGEISTDDNTNFCFNSGEIDSLSINLENAEGDLGLFIVADTSGNILVTSESNVLNLESISMDLCEVFHLSFDDDTQLPIIGQNLSDITDCFGISNGIQIFKSQVGPSIISSNSSLQVCLGDGFSDPIEVDLTDNTTTNNAWIITDLDNNITEIPFAPPFDFEGFQTGSAVIWNVNFEGSLMGLEIGSNLSELEGCFALSNNIIIEPNEANGGTISTLDQTSFCLADGEGIVNVELTGAIGAQSIWVTTDINRIILSTQDEAVFDFTDAEQGQCLIWNVALSDANQVIPNGILIDDIESCFDLSNPLLINKTDVEAASISTSSSTSVCGGDGIEDIVEIELENLTSTGSLFIMTDTLGLIIDTSSVAAFDVEETNLERCQIWHLSFEGVILGAEPGFNISVIAGCFEFSNAITINKDAVFGGEIFTNNSTSVCSGIDDQIDIVVAFSNQPIGNQGIFLLTELDGTIIGFQESNEFDFDGFPTGSCLVSHLAFSDNIDLETIGNISELNACFNLSNTIQIQKDEITATEISSSSDTFICLSDEIEDIVDISISGTIGPDDIILLTDTSGLIVSLLDESQIDLSSLDLDICLISHLNFIGNLIGLEIGNSISDLEGCFAISNSIEFRKPQVSGGFIFSTGPTTICLSDEIPQLVNLSLLDNVGSGNVWIVVDEAGTILSIPSELPFDLSDQEAGICEIYNMSFEGSVEGLEIGNSLDGITGCIDFSNPISIIKTLTEGGIVSSSENETEISVCVGDLVADSISFLATNAISPNYRYVITSEENRILEVLDSDVFDFETNSIGICRVWGVAFSGIGTILPGEDITTANLATGCFDLSDGFLTVIKTEDGEACTGFTSEFQTDIEFSVFPNPAVDQMVIDIKNMPYPDGEIELIDMHGRIVLTKEIGFNNPDLIPVDIARFSKGVYTIRIHSLGTVAQKPIVISR